MSFLKKPFRKFKELNGSSTNNSSDSVPSKEEGISGSSTPSTAVNGTSTPNGNGNTPPESKRQSLDVDRKRRSMDKARTKAENKKRQSMARIEDERFLKEGPPALTKLYKPYSMNMSKKWDQEKRQLFKELDFKRESGKFEIAESPLIDRRNGRRSYYIPSSYTHPPPNERKACIHCVPSTNHNHSRSFAEFQTQERIEAYAFPPQFQYLANIFQPMKTTPVPFPSRWFEV